MTEPAAIVQMCVGELYRYRLAANEQRPRVQQAVDAARAERQRIKQAEYELLFAPSMSMDAFEAQLLAIHNRDIQFVWRLKSEVEFMITAVYGVLTMARTLGRFADDERRTCVREAIESFMTAAPDADILRHVHVHPETHLLGEGPTAGRLPDPTSESGIALPDGEGPIYLVGGKLFIVWDIADAAETLAVRVAECHGTSRLSE